MDAVFKEKLMAMAKDIEPFDVHNHISVADVDDGVGVVELDIHPESLNIWGTPHGGLLYTLSDVACGCAVLTMRPESHVTVTGSMDYLRPAPSAGKVIATGRAVMCFTGKPML